MPSAIDRNARARLLFQAECLDRRTRLPGDHGGMIKRSGLAVLRALLFHFANVVTGRCDPSYDAIARAAGVCRSTVAIALKRLEMCRLLVRVRRRIGRRQWTNRYVFPSESEFRTETTNKNLEQGCATSVPPSPPLPSGRKDTREELLASARRLGIPLKGKG